ncbi:hypothetical protein DPMN_097027 [Dreissena polymorpha]|uniref:Uncharacterized protein n=1 Tax=Dreissena polymorpha TaxID=45954 RepID=A0A9D4LAX2_DREPO|nr:hypothetical protein DPMN_097027 [Dreissena polymorpha]
MILQVHRVRVIPAIRFNQFMAMPSHMLMTQVSVMKALEVSVFRHLLTSMKSPHIPKDQK